MGFFQSLLGTKPATQSSTANSKMRVAGLAASCIDYVISDIGVEGLLAGSLVLNKNLHPSFRSGKPDVGGDIAASVPIDSLAEAEVYKIAVKLNSKDASMFSPFTDLLVHAAMDVFERQSPAFSALEW
jgi:hypothetical protein